MNRALNRTQGRAAKSGGHFQAIANDALLASPEGAALFARISAATIEPEFFRRHDEHVRAVCFTVLKARGAA